MGHWFAWEASGFTTLKRLNYNNEILEIDLAPFLLFEMDSKGHEKRVIMN